MSSGRVLIVDDEPQIRRALRSTLASRGYEVQEARTGEDALLAVRKCRFDLILLDVNMPGMNGLDACREIRETSVAAIIMLTVSDREEDKVTALDAGADDYITKPFGTPELLARMRAALRRLPVATKHDQPVHLGSLQINFPMRRVVAKDHEIHLTPKEFDLLHYLMAHSNVAIPHAKLLQAVWGPDYAGEVQYLRVFVNQLRKKIEPDPAHPRYILTEPWIGYRFAAE